MQTTPNLPTTRSPKEAASQGSTTKVAIDISYPSDILPDLHSANRDVRIRINESSNANVLHIASRAGEIEVVVDVVVGREETCHLRICARQPEWDVIFGVGVLVPCDVRHLGWSTAAQVDALHGEDDHLSVVLDDIAELDASVATLERLGPPCLRVNPQDITVCRGPLGELPVLIALAHREPDFTTNVYVHRGSGGNNRPDGD